LATVRRYPRAAVRPRQPFLERDYYSDPRRRGRSAAVRLLSRPLRRAGFDLEVRTFYSPIPDLTRIGDEVWNRRSPLPAIDFDLEHQLSYLTGELGGYLGEFRPPREPSRDRMQFHLDNGLFGAGDAEILYATVRANRPAMILELGAGFSTLVSAAAVRANRSQGHESRLISCDPYASPGAASAVDGLAELRPIAAEELDAEVFDGLGRGDILFIDSSHTVKVGGDVVHLLCEVLPRLRAGVLVHVHDIYLPYEYPREWFHHNRWYWAEQYLLQALLCGNSRFEILIAAYALWREEHSRLVAEIPTLDSSAPPLSLWMRVRDEAA
jgi:hypothetical protein